MKWLKWNIFSCQYYIQIGNLFDEKDLGYLNVSYKDHLDTATSLAAQQQCQAVELN